MENGKPAREEMVPSGDEGQAGVGLGGAAALDDHGICLWNLENGTLIARQGGVPGKVLQVSFSPDGRRAVYACGDGAVRIWDLEKSGP